MKEEAPKCPKGGLREGRHYWVTYVERLPQIDVTTKPRMRRGLECNDCGYRPELKV